MLVSYLPYERIVFIAINTAAETLGYITSVRSSTTRCGNSHLAPCSMLFCGLNRVEGSCLPYGGMG